MYHRPIEWVLVTDSDSDSFAYIIVHLTDGSHKYKMSTKLLTYMVLKHVNIFIIYCKNIEIAINFYYLAILSHKW